MIWGYALGGGKLGMIFGDTVCRWLGTFGDALGGGKLGMIFGDLGLFESVKVLLFAISRATNTYFVNFQQYHRFLTHLKYYFL